MTNEFAMEIAMEAADILRPYCERIEIAGSIRRGRREVGDIELVCVRKRSGAALVGFVDAFRRWGIEKWEPAGGKYIRTKKVRGMNMDVFVARPENFGLIFLIRTGSVEWMRSFVIPKLRARGYVMRDGDLWNSKTQKIVETPNEEEVFKRMGIYPVHPYGRS